MDLLFQIFILFTRVALFSWGGGPASLALMQREVLSAGWATAEEFADAVAVSNALPGPIAPQVSAYVGYKLAGIPGAISATMGSVVPTTVLMLVMIAIFFGVKNSPAVVAMLKAVRPLVVGLLAFVAFDMFRTVWGAPSMGWGKALAMGWDKAAIAGVTFVLLLFTNISPAWLVLGAAILGYLVYK
jgi:chromate transporter